MLQGVWMGRRLALEINLMHWLDTSHLAVRVVGLIVGGLYHCSG